MPSFEQTITFLHASDLGPLARFYSGLLGLPLVRDQGSCILFQSAPGAYLGFCSHLTAGQKEGVILTFVAEDVDGWYARLQAQGVVFLGPPVHNPKFQIYHCLLRDPNGYLLEIQKFDQPLAKCEEPA